MKDEQVEVLVDWFDELKSMYCINTKYIHCDNAGEKVLQQQVNFGQHGHHSMPNCSSNKDIDE